MVDPKWRIPAVDAPGWAPTRHDPDKCTLCDAKWWRFRGLVPANPTSRELQVDTQDYRGKWWEREGIEYNFEWRTYHVEKGK